jgi:hypothetical protein
MRKTVEVAITDRGAELRFRITEMPATRLESWVMRALLLLGPVLGKVDGEDVTLADAGRLLGSKDLWSVLSTIDYDRGKPLLDEMLECCERIDAGVPQRCTSSSVDAYVSDVSTLFKLRMEALKLNLAFFGQGRENPSPFPRSANSARPATVEISRS